MSSKYVYKQMNKARFDEMRVAYDNFIAATNDPSTTPFSVYTPLNEKMVQELELIREISQELMKKKEEDIKKAAQAAEQAEETKEEQKTEDVEDTPEAEVTQQEEKNE